MPGHEGKIETRCPVCQARYRVPAASAGHRARCVKCRTTFRVPQIQSAQPPVDRPRAPSEEDILRWLNEGSDEEIVAPRPRIISDKEPVETGPESEEKPPEPRVAALNPPSDSVLDPHAAAPRHGLRRTG